MILNTNNTSWEMLLVLKNHGISDELYDALDNNAMLDDLDPVLKLEIIELIIKFSKRKDHKEQYHLMSKDDQLLAQQYYIDSFESEKIMGYTNDKSIHDLVLLDFYK